MILHLIVLVGCIVINITYVPWILRVADEHPTIYKYISRQNVRSYRQKKVTLV